MKTKSLLRSLTISTILLVAPLAANAAPVALSLSEQGLNLKAGALGDFTISGPQLRNTEQQEVPLVSRVAKNAQTAICTFHDGTIVTTFLDDIGKTLTIDYAQHSATAKSIALNAFVPFELRNGGTVSFDGKIMALPLELKAGPEGYDIWRGEAGRFEIKTTLGQILAINAPRGWQQLQDNRFWNGNQSFQWLYLHDMQGEPDKTSFRIKFEDAAQGAPAPEVPRQIVDQFGQSKLVDFPDKVTSVAELKADIARDTTYYDSFTMPARDIYGGLPDSGAQFKLQKTGFFHIEKIQDAKRGTLPVLVDPLGNLYFQIGLCAMGSGGDSYTLLQDRADKFAWLPPKDGEFASSFIDGGASFSFYDTNWTRKFGKPWNREDFTAQTIERVRKLGFNSSGAFSDSIGAQRKANFPYVGWLDFQSIDTIPDTHGIIDPFADNAAAQLDKNFAVLTVDNDDPLLIGHFLGNEQPFENIPKIVPGLDGKSGAKRRLVKLLQDKYGDIKKFNAAWEMKTPALNFAALNDERLFVVSQSASEDMSAYFDLFLDSYYGLIDRTYDRYCPHHLLLGSRYLSSTANSDAVCRAAGKYLDVISVNYYTYALETDFLTRIHKLSGGRPILLSEWHYGATNQGLSGGARQVRDQRERGLAYRNYVEGAAALGFVIGQQWFSYLDQPLTGRWFEGDNGEKGNIGLVNVADRPYKEFLAEATQANANVYPVLLGDKAPFRYQDARFSGTQGAAQKTLLIPRALPGMTINGIQDNWPGLPAERITPANLVLGTTGDGISADFRLAWDDTNLYLFALVKDPTPMQNDNPPDSIWAGDSIELFIGADKLAQGGPMQFGDRQVLLSAHKGADGYRWYFNNAPTQSKVEMEVVKNVGNDGYTIEAAIPFAGLGFTPRENQELLFDIGVNDATAGRRQLIWNGGARNSGDRGAWGRTKLVK